MPTALVRKPLPKPSPQSDPRYRRVMEQLKAGAKRTGTHPPASKKAADAAAAAKGPANERLATGKAKQVDKIQAAKEGKPEPSSFLAMLRAEISKAMPKDLGETENFDQAADGMKSGLKGNVSQQKEKSTQDVAGASKQTPSPAGEAKEGGAVPKEAAPASPNVAASEAMPAPKTDQDISLQDSKQNTEQQMKEAEVTPTQLQKANDPRFSAVLDAKRQVAQNADAGPGLYRTAEKATLAGVSAQATAKARAGAAAMVGVRAGGNTRVLTRQQEQKARDEAAREKVAKGIESIFVETKQRVDAKLAAIDVEVNAMFDSGTEAALSAMKKYVNARIRDYKIDRYLSIPLVGLARWVRDQFLNLPDEVNVFYEQGRALFQERMDAVIVRVAALVEQRLKEAKAEVAAGKQKIQVFVDGQPKELKQFAADAQAKVSAGFDEMEQGIENKKNELASSLAQKYKEGFDKANEALKAIQDANKGFVAAFAEKLAAIIKAILEFKARLSSILAKGASALKLIIADPLGFLGNLIDAVKGGITAFSKNITEHLKTGFMRWLLGNMPPGIEIPKDFSPGSILKLVMGVLGITFDKMREKAVKLLGPRTVSLIETAVRYVKALLDGGPAKLWEEVKDDLSDLSKLVIDAFQEWMITTIVKKAVAKIVLLFNPAGAIIQAILAIVAIVQFVVQKAMQILDFVEAVVNSIYEIATGAISAAVKKIEDALARAIPLLIGFLASLLGLGGVAEKIKEFVFKVQTKVDKAIDKAIAKVVEVVKKVAGTVKEGVKALLQWWKREKRFNAGGKSHRLFFQGEARSASMKVASTEMSLRDFLAQARKDKKDAPTIAMIETLQTEIEQLRLTRNPSTPDGQDPVVDQKISDRFDLIANELPKLFSSGEWGTKTNPLMLLRYPKKAASLYRTIYLGPRVKEGKRLAQAALKAHAGEEHTRQAGFDPKTPIDPGDLDQWVKNGGKVREYRPFERVPLPDGANTVGVEAQFLVQTGTSFKYQPGEGTPGGATLNEPLKKFGYYGSSEDTDGDHILETQLIGRTRANVLANLWPLGKHENRHGESLRTKAKAKVENATPPIEFEGLDQATKAKPEEIYIMIKGTV